MSKDRTQACQFSGIFYPESQSINDFIQKITEVGLQCAISPLHDKDVWLATDEVPDDSSIGDLKKAHYHFYIKFPTRHTSSGAKKVLNDNLGVVVPTLKVTFVANSIFRYFCHLDDIRKYQYDVKDITLINGIHLDLSPTFSKEDKLIANNNDLLSVILNDSNNISDFRALTIHYLDNPDMIDYLRKNAFFVKCLLKN